jgi:hypothetical protein
MGYVIDHTGKARPLRRAFSGPTYRWNFNPGSPEQEIGFSVMEPQRLDMTRRDFLMSSNLTQPVDPWWMRRGWVIGGDNLPWNHPDYKGKWK